MTRYATFDRSQIELRHLSERGHDLTLAGVRPLGATFSPYPHPEFPQLIEHVAATCVGPGTKIEQYLGLERNYVPTDRASCGVMFHGRLLPAE